MQQVTWRCGCDPAIGSERRESALEGFVKAATLPIALAVGGPFSALNGDVRISVSIDSRLDCGRRSPHRWKARAEVWPKISARLTSVCDEYQCVGECRDRLRAANFTTRFASSLVAS